MAIHPGPHTQDHLREMVPEGWWQALHHAVDELRVGPGSMEDTSIGLPPETANQDPD